MRKRYLLAVVAGIGSVIAPASAQGPGGGGQGRGRTGGFPQYTRPLASQDVLARGKSLYDANCASCHATDLRGMPAKN